MASGNYPVDCTEDELGQRRQLVAASDGPTHIVPTCVQESSKPRVYISYAEESQEYVSRLQHILQTNLGYRQRDICTLESDSIPGLNVAQNIMNLVKTCKKLIIVISKNYTDSHWSNYEMATILDNGNIATADIIPIICNDGSTKNDLPDELCILIPLHANDRNFTRKLNQSLEYRK